MSQCERCGAATSGVLLCLYCGSAIRTPLDEAEERLATDELHRAVEAASNDYDRVKALLRTASIPTSEDPLVDAGTRLIPLLDGLHADAAASRLAAVVTNLRIRGESAAAKRAIDHLEKVLGAHQAKRRADERLGGWCLVGCVLLGLGLMAALGYFASLG